MSLSSLNHIHNTRIKRKETFSILFISLLLLLFFHKKTNDDYR